jgi:hypothetical protein
MDVVSFYFPENTAQYRDKMKDVAGDCDRLLEMMAVLMYGSDGATQEALDEAYANLQNDPELESAKFYKVTGKVIDSETSAALKDAVVEVSGTGTDYYDAVFGIEEDGSFELPMLVGTFTFTVSLDGYDTYEQKVNINSNFGLGIIKIEKKSYIELSQYIDDYELFRDMIGATVLSSEGDYTAYDSSPSEKVGCAHSENNTFVELFDCKSDKYSLYGVYVGQSVEDAQKALDSYGWTYDKSMDTRYFYVLIPENSFIHTRHLEINYDLKSSTVTELYYWSESLILDDVIGTWISTEYISHHNEPDYQNPLYMIIQIYLNSYDEININMSSSGIHWFIADGGEYYISNGKLYAGFWYSYNIYEYSYNPNTGVLTIQKDDEIYTFCRGEKFEDGYIDSGKTYINTYPEGRY